MQLQILRKTCQVIWELPLRLVKILFVVMVLLCDTVIGVPYNRCLVKAVIFIIGCYRHFHLEDGGTRFLRQRQTLEQKRVVLDKNNFATFIRERHNDNDTPLRDLVEKNYGKNAVAFIERYI